MTRVKSDCRNSGVERWLRAKIEWLRQGIGGILGFGGVGVVAGQDSLKSAGGSGHRPHFELRNFKFPLKYHILPSAVNI
jgi:hypothetical protein